MGRSASVSLTSRPSARLRSPTSDFLYSAKAIANQFEVSPGQVKPLQDSGLIPTFKLPGSEVLCAFKSEIYARLEECRRRWRTKRPLRELDDVVADIKKRKRRVAEAKKLKLKAAKPKE